MNGRGWEILDPQGRSYMRAISDRRKLLLGEACWSKLDADSRRRLKGSYRRKDLEWWGLTGRIVRKSWPAVRQNERMVRANLEAVRQAHDREFPDIAVDAMRALMDIDNLGCGTATLLLTLARPDRLLSLNTRSQKGYGALSRMSPSTLGKPPRTTASCFDGSIASVGTTTGRQRMKVWFRSGDSAPPSLTRLCTNRRRGAAGVLAAPPRELS